MAIWGDMVANVYVWTNRPDMVNETELAIRQAIRAAHRLGKFSKDLAIVLAPASIDPDTPTQQIDITTYLPRFKQICYIKDKGADKYYSPATADDLLDHDGYVRQDVYWNIGTEINIRSCAPQDIYEIAYFQQPVTAPPASLDDNDWLLKNYQDVVVLFAVGTITGLIGETDIKTRADSLLALEISGMLADNIEITGR